jgi:2-oxoglutarate dehydrogenase E1 component
MSQSLADQLATTALSGGNAGFIEDLYEQFLRDPTSVDPPWREYFGNLRGSAGEVAHGPIRERLLARLQQRAAPAAAPGNRSDGASAKQGAVSRLIQVYANRGHLIAKLDPLGLQERAKPYVLDLVYFGLSEADLDTEFFTGSRNSAIPERTTLKNILADLKYIYTDTIGAEFAHVSDTDERLWLQDAFQVARVQRRFSVDEKKNILWQLTAAEGLERYLHTKYVGQKRFSLEGGDSLIPLLDYLVQQGGKSGVEETIIGMAHRGRLNVLVNLLGKSPKDLFSEFEGQYDLAKLRGSGDVKYHKGFSADLKTGFGNVHVALAFNPSHLEVVNAVVEGSARARQERRGDALGDKVLPVQIHGDAAFAGQGVIMETLQLSQARGFYTGGTVHIIINNQVGFTTSDPRDARSTLYCSDVAKMVEAPIFHVNADDPEAVCFVTRFALEYRMKFHKDVVIDLVCYRRHGHNEADEPAATQPLMYQVIRKKPTVRQLYADKLNAEGVMSSAEAAAMMEQYRAGLDEGKPQARAALGLIGNRYTVDWSEYLGADWSRRASI